MQHIDFMGLTCVITVISTYTQNNLCIDTVGYPLPGLLSPPGAMLDFSCIHFFFSWYFCKIIVCPHEFAPHKQSETLSLYALSWWVSWTSLQLVWCCRHHPFYVSLFHRSRLSKPGLTQRITMVLIVDCWLSLLGLVEADWSERSGKSWSGFMI